MPSYRTGTVTKLLSERTGLQRVEVEGRPAYVLTQLIGPVAVGDRVVVNATAVELGLGTGGWDVVHWNLERQEWSELGPGHEMKLRYTSLQVDAGVAPQPERTVEMGAPMVACFLHSQVAAVAAAFKHVAPEATLGYVMTEGGALPLAVSELVPDLVRVGWVDVTVTAGQAFGGQREAVNVAHALQLTVDCDAIVVGMGPGSLGTDSAFGFSGLEVASTLTLGALGREPIVALRWSDADPRERHRGLSHHSVTALKLTPSAVVVPIPAGAPHPKVGDHEVVEVDVPDVGALFKDAGLDVRTMGRTPAEDPGFFAYAAAAGVAAAERTR
ncbi:MAG TPA: DUF3866 family protein [Acidimicrobiales bacterium]|nr:DUF3866 family protein [Acidimicrobiales bacterium]